ncbi:hypothetical protein [Photorhabdus khanii]|nr:hypothetical protein [Photorhabdus khanii]
MKKLLELRQQKADLPHQMRPSSPKPKEEKRFRFTSSDTSQNIWIL